MTTTDIDNMTNDELDRAVAEEWRPVVGWEKNYEVSNAGRVRRIKTGRILKNCKSGRYDFVTLYPIGKSKNERVHVLVAEAFHGKRPNGYEVNHKDANKRNNRAENLEWVTPKENHMHAIGLGLGGAGRGSGHGTHTCPESYRGERRWNAKLKESQVLEILRIGKSVSRQFLADKYGVTRMAISDIVNGKNWKHLKAVCEVQDG